MVLDASAIVDLFVPSANDERIRSFLRRSRQMPIISDFAAGEFAGAIKRRVFVNLMSHTEAVDMIVRFDAWLSSNAELISTAPEDVRLAAVFVRCFDIPLRMPDAMYLAVAHRIGAPLCSFDVEQIAAARRLGVDVVAIS
jgi:uncharacterized protein